MIAGFKLFSEAASNAAFVLALLLNCSCRSASGTSDASSTMTRVEFVAATGADLEAGGAELDGREGVGRVGAPGAGNAFQRSDSLTREEFFAATAEDVARARGELEDRDSLDTSGLAATVVSATPVSRIAAAGSDVQITLHDSWIASVQNKATVSITFDPEGMSKVHPVDKGGDDGDVHIGGVSKEVGLPLVVEVMNAAGHPAVAEARAAIEDDAVVTVAGAWRLWCEHPGVPQIQFDTPYDGPPSNPDHVFEVHPATSWGTTSCLATFKPISKGGNEYEAYDAQKAFRYYESVPCRLEHDSVSRTTTIYTPQARYNYAEFVITPDEDEGLITGDGYILRCSVLDDSGKKVTDNRRMVFVKGTSVYSSARALKRGASLRVLGIPRVDLAVIRWRIRNADDRPEVLTWNLPYEMICVAEL